MLRRILENGPSLLGAYLMATGVFQLAVAQVSNEHLKHKDRSPENLLLAIGGIIWTMCVLVGVGFHFGSDGKISLLPISILTLVFIHLNAMLICGKPMANVEPILSQVFVLFSLLGLAAHFATDVWLLRQLAESFTILVILRAAESVIKLSRAAAASTLSRSGAGVDALSSLVAHLCDTFAGLLILCITLWVYLGTEDRESREYTLASTSILTAICFVDMCICQLNRDKEPALEHANRALSGVLLTFLVYATIAKHVD